MSFLILSLFWIVDLSLLIHVIALSIGTPSSQIQSLQALYNSTRGEEWIWKNEITNGPRWTFSIELQVDPCNDNSESWQGITCSSPPSLCKIQDCTIVSLILNGYGLDGTLPSEMFIALTTLTTLKIMRSSMLIGSLPSSIGLLTDLQELSFSSNSLSLEIPTTLQSIHNLKSLDLTRNHFSGTIPAEWSAFPLSILFLGYNSFTGSIPPELGSLSLLQSMYLDYNQLTQTLPFQLSALTMLSVMSLIGNILTGPIPTQFGELVNLSQLSLDRNELSGTIPSQLCSLNGLTELTLSLNGLRGTISSEFGLLLKLNTLYLNSNLLTGSIPSEFGLLSNLFILSLQSNFLSKTIPSEMGFMSQVVVFYLQSNELTGAIPSELSQLTDSTTISISANRLTGSIPSELCLLSNLRELYLDSNQLTGTIPPELGQFHQLTLLTIGENLLSQSIPSELSNISQLSIIFLNYNQLTGTLPVELGALSDLIFFLADHNMLTGHIPSQVAGMKTNQIVDLSFNHFTSSIPSEIGLSTSLEELVLSHNSLTGPIPSSLTRLSNLAILHLHENNLHGKINLQLSNFPFLEQLFLHQNHFTGKLNSLFKNQSSRLLVNLDVSDNLLSGSVPSTVFLLPRLESISLSLNCFEGELPEAMCEANGVGVISMDGLRSAEDCKHSVKIPFTGVTLGRSMDGSIPECVWLLPKLRILNLAGNGLTGTIGSTSSMQSLLSMTLSHNYLSGSIPLWLQEKNLSTLDLSHNKLGGDISGFRHQVGQLEGVVNGEVSLGSDRILTLSVNRLSGELSHSFSRYSSLDILSGNLFGCNYIPSLDKNSEWVSCGSEEYDQAMSVMGGVLGVFVILILFSCLIIVYRTFLSHHFLTTISVISIVSSGDDQQSDGGNETLSGCSAWMDRRTTDLFQVIQYLKYFSSSSSAQLVKSYSINSLNSILIFGEVLSQMVKWLWVLMLVSLLLSLPIYILKEHSDGNQDHHTHADYVTHSHLYHWIWTMAFLSGKLPALLLLVVTCGSLLIFSFILYKVSKEFPSSAPLSHSQSTPRTVVPQSRLFVWIVLNLIIVGTVNGLYLWSSLVDLSPDYRTAIQLAFGIFSFLWSVLLRSLMAASIKESRSGMWLFTCLNLMNNVLIPCLVTSLSSPSCYQVSHPSFPSRSLSLSLPISLGGYSFPSLLIPAQRLLVPPDKISSSYTYQHCEVRTSKLMECALSMLVPMDTLEITPPFTYSYQCGSTLLVSYLPVYMYSVSLQMVMTFLKLSLIFSVNLFPPTEWMLRLYSALHWPLHKLSSSSSSSPLTQTEIIQLIEPSQIISNAMNNITLLLSFGLCSPVFGFYILINLSINLCSWIMLVGRYLILRGPLFSSPFPSPSLGNDRGGDNCGCGEDGLILPSSASGDQSESVSLLNQQIQGVQDYLIICKWPVIYTSCFFMTLLCWDIAGDEVGWYDALWVPLSGVGILLLVTLCEMLLRRGLADQWISPPVDTSLSHSLTSNLDPERISEHHSPLVQTPSPSVHAVELLQVLQMDPSSSLPVPFPPLSDVQK